MASSLHHSGEENHEVVPKVWWQGWRNGRGTALLSPIPSYRSCHMMGTLVLEAPQDIQASSPQHAALIPQQTANLSTDDQEPPKHSGPQEASKVITRSPSCKVLCEVSHLTLRSQPHLGPELPCSCKHNIPAQGFQTTRVFSSAH